MRTLLLQYQQTDTMFYFINIQQQASFFTQHEQFRTYIHLTSPNNSNPSQNGFLNPQQNHQTHSFIFHFFHTHHPLFLDLYSNKLSSLSLLSKTTGQPNHQFLHLNRIGKSLFLHGTERLLFFFFGNSTFVHCFLSSDLVQRRSSGSYSYLTMNKLSRLWMTFLTKCRIFIIIAWSLGLLLLRGFVFSHSLIAFYRRLIACCGVFLFFSSPQVPLGPSILWSSSFPRPPWRSTRQLAQMFVPPTMHEQSHENAFFMKRCT